MRLVVALVFVLSACHHDPKPVDADRPPLPPASGTPVGYLIDAATDLKLRDDQLEHLKAIDTNLAAKDADIDTQLRQIEKPEEEEQLSPQQQKAGMKRQRHNNAPGAAVVTTADAAKLHEIRNANDRDALKQAWTVLDPEQQTTAKRILDYRGIPVPGAAKQAPATSDDDGKPVPGLEP